jgi:tetratricopeptide (TPR) repeat protein
VTQPLLTSAVQAHRAGNSAEAARLYGEVLRIDPRQFTALYGLGVLHYQAGNMQQAERLMADAARVNPSSSEAFFTRGCALQRLNRPTEALICFDHVIKLKPDAAEAYGNRGVVLMALNKHAEALDSLKTAIGLDASNAAHWNNRGCVLNNVARYDEAISCFDAALAQQPRFTQALINRGSAKAALKRYGAATADFEQVLSIDPHAPYVAGNLAHFRMQSSAWPHYERDKAAIAQGVRAGRRVVMPFIHLGLSDSPADQLRCASIWTAHELPVQVPPLWRGERYRHDRIRVAYVSADFHSHATAELMAGVWERHDRSNFETFAISFGRASRTRSIASSM